ncbi:uncharacterized protein [Euwallacea fornicatus]|uniref:uncharacterized protein n=1 Tax=Euwallacea fornicatus TaxID=995702 RepID=UPI00338D3CB7
MAMVRCLNSIGIIKFLAKIPNARLYSFDNSKLKITEEIGTALIELKPVLALESTIITHGMPYPRNIECALEVEDTVRAQGAIPATIAIINGSVKVGLSRGDLEFLGDTDKSKPVKTSLRDFAHVLSKNLNGGTTVAGTIAVCKKVGIDVFATGGIGGVHRGANESFDVSADLTELGRSRIAVVSSGVKSILDIPKTLEYLETQGVHVCTIGPNAKFPAFYCESSGCDSPYNVPTTLDAARSIQAHIGMGLESGLLFAVPVPEPFALNPESIDKLIEEALAKADTAAIRGKMITPFLLSQIAEMTSGNSLETNVALIKNNAKFAAQIAWHLSQMRTNAKRISEPPKAKKQLSAPQNPPVIIGGSNLDCVAHLDVSEIKLDGRIHVGHFDYSSGGVGRNICEALAKLGCPSHFISAVGDDYQGRILKKQIPKQSQHCLATLPGDNTAQCIVTLDNKGDCSFLMGDMRIHDRISAEMIQTFEEVLKLAPLIIMDGNISVAAMERTLSLAQKYKIPVLFEPTDISTARKPFTTKNWKVIKLITPNLGELQEILTELNISVSELSSNDIETVADAALKLAHFVENVLVTLGPSGIILARRGRAEDSPLKWSNNKISVRYYPVEERKDFVNVSGAGDCFASGFIAALLRNCPESVCVSVGFASALTALYSQSPVPKEMFDVSDVSWQSEAKYRELQ